MPPRHTPTHPPPPQPDIGSLGVVFSGGATGRLPYRGQAAPEIARKIVEESPASPKATSPDLDGSVLSVMGRCLFKDPFKRHKDARSMLDDISRAEPQAMTFAAEIARAAVQPATIATASTRDVVLLLADVAGY